MFLLKILIANINEIEERVSTAYNITFFIRETKR